MREGAYLRPTISRNGIIPQPLMRSGKRLLAVVTVGRCEGSEGEKSRLRNKHGVLAENEDRLSDCSCTWRYLSWPQTTPDAGYYTDILLYNILRSRTNVPLPPTS